MNVKRAAMAAVNAPSATPTVAANAASAQVNVPTTAAVQTVRQPWVSLLIRKRCRTQPPWPIARASSWMRRPPLAKPRAPRLATRHALHANAAAATVMAATAVNVASAMAMQRMATLAIAVAMA